MGKPELIRMGHVALEVQDVAEAARFYREVLGLAPAWRLDEDFTLFRAARYLEEQGVRLAGPVRDHRDGSRTVYFHDPDGNLLEILWDPQNPT